MENLVSWCHVSLLRACAVRKIVRIRSIDSVQFDVHLFDIPKLKFLAIILRWNKICG